MICAVDAGLDALSAVMGWRAVNGRAGQSVVSPLRLSFGSTVTHLRRRSPKPFFWLGTGDVSLSFVDVGKQCTSLHALLQECNHGCTGLAGSIISASAVAQSISSDTV